MSVKNPNPIDEYRSDILVVATNRFYSELHGTDLPEEDIFVSTPEIRDGSEEGFREALKTQAKVDAIVRIAGHLAVSRERAETKGPIKGLSSRIEAKLGGALNYFIIGGKELRPGGLIDQIRGKS